MMTTKAKNLMFEEALRQTGTAKYHITINKITDGWVYIDVEYDLAGERMTVQKDIQMAAGTSIVLPGSIKLSPA